MDGYAADEAMLEIVAVAPPYAHPVLAPVAVAVPGDDGVAEALPDGNAGDVGAGGGLWDALADAGDEDLVAAGAGAHGGDVAGFGGEAEAPAAAGSLPVKHVSWLHLMLASWQLDYAVSSAALNRLLGILRDHRADYSRLCRDARTLKRLQRTAVEANSVHFTARTFNRTVAAGDADPLELTGTVWYRDLREVALSLLQAPGLQLDGLFMHPGSVAAASHYTLRPPYATYHEQAAALAEARGIDAAAVFVVGLIFNFDGTVRRGHHLDPGYVKLAALPAVATQLPAACQLMCMMRRPDMPSAGSEAVAAAKAMFQDQLEVAVYDQLLALRDELIPFDGTLMLGAGYVGRKLYALVRPVMITGDHIGLVEVLGCKQNACIQCTVRPCSDEMFHSLDTLRFLNPGFMRDVPATASHLALAMEGDATAEAWLGARGIHKRRCAHLRFVERADGMLPSDARALLRCDPMHTLPGGIVKRTVTGVFEMLPAERANLLDAYVAAQRPFTAEGRTACGFIRGFAKLPRVTAKQASDALELVLAGVTALNKELLPEPPGKWLQVVRLLGALRTAVQLCHVRSATDTDVADLGAAVASARELLPVVFTTIDWERSPKFHNLLHLVEDLDELRSLLYQSCEGFEHMHTLVCVQAEKRSDNKNVHAAVVADVTARLSLQRAVETLGGAEAGSALHPLLCPPHPDEYVCSGRMTSEEANFAVNMTGFVHSYIDHFDHACDDAAVTYYSSCTIWRAGRPTVMHATPSHHGAPLMDTVVVREPTPPGADASPDVNVHSMWVAVVAGIFYYEPWNAAYVALLQYKKESSSAHVCPGVCTARKLKPWIATQLGGVELSTIARKVRPFPIPRLASTDVEHIPEGPLGDYMRRLSACVFLQGRWAEVDGDEV